MPLRLIDEDDNSWPTRHQQCRSPEHHPPSMIVLPPGLYEHECPQCGAKQRIRVPEPPTLLSRPVCPPNIQVPAGIVGWRDFLRGDT